MSTRQSSKPGRALFAATLAGALCASALPVLAATQSPATVSTHQREIDPQIAGIAAQTGRALVRDMHGILGHLKTHDIALAQSELKKSLSLANSLETLLPYTSVVNKVTDQQGKVESETVEEFHQSLVPIYADVEEMRVYVPKAAAQAKQHLDQAGKQMQAGNKQAAKQSLRLVADDISTRTIYLPVGEVRSDLKVAMEALEKKAPDVHGASQAVEKALRSVRGLVDEVSVINAPAKG